MKVSDTNGNTVLPLLFKENLMDKFEKDALESLQNKGFAVVVFDPEEFSNTDLERKNIEDALTEQGNMLIEQSKRKRTYRIPVRWMVEGDFMVEAYSLAEAVNKVEDAEPPCEELPRSEPVDDTLKICKDEIEEEQLTLADKKYLNRMGIRF